MENYSLETLSKASQSMYHLADQVLNYENLDKKMKRLNGEMTRLQKAGKVNPHNRVFLWGLIGLGVGTIGQPIFWVIEFVIYFIVATIASFNDGLYDMVISTFPVLILLINIVLPVVGYGSATIISYLIMKFSNYREKRKAKLERQILDIQDRQLKVQNEMDDLIEMFNNEKCLLPHIPIPYQYSIAIRKFGDYFAQGRANSIKEAANLYEQDLRYEQQQRQLQQINNGIVANNTINATCAAMDAVTDIFFIASFL